MHAPADNGTPLSASSSGLRQFLGTALGGVFLPAVLCAVLWIVISYATGGSTLFSLGGGIVVGVIAFIIGYGFRQIFSRRRP
jgi:hypothetical protein